jgi:hemolysin activation/secretion protein
VLKPPILPLALWLVVQAAHGQPLPSAGSQLQQIPQVPAPQEANPAIRIESAAPSASPASDAMKIQVLRLGVTGASVYSESELLALTGFQPGSELSLADLQAMATKITDHYRGQGYFVAQAYLAPQEIKDGAVTITVIEGRYGKIDVRNRSALSDARIQQHLEGLHKGDTLRIEPIENRLLLLSDIPGVKVSSTLTPGASVGESDLIVDVVPGERVTGSIDADNAGNRYTGEYRLGATVNLNNAAGLGDVASLRALTSGSGLKYARASYQVPWHRATVGVAYSWLEYELGREFAFAQASGTAHVASLFGSYALIRSRQSRLYAGLAFDAKSFQDRRPLSPDMPLEDKRAQVLTASLRGDRRDAFGGGGTTGFSVAWSTGHIDLRTPGLRLNDAPVQSNGGFHKLSFGASRLQSVSSRLSLFAGVNGQVASKNLDVSEKMALGGMYGVRAYPEGEAYGDQGYLATLEARLQLPRYDHMPGQWQLIGFVDSGSVTINKKPWSSALSNDRTLHGAGVGLQWASTDNFSMRAYYARKLGNEPATSAPDKSGRFWIQAVKYF